MKRKNKLSSSGLGVRARRFMESNPAASPSEVAARFNLSKPYVYGLRSKMKKEEQMPSLAPAEPWQPPEINQVDATLDARAVDYGKFIEGAEVMQMLKRVVQVALNNRDKTLAHDQAEAMDMIIHKIGRIINGNPDVVDHWLDVAGYAQLVADRLEGRIR
jgi:hypothetical protein